MNGHFDGEEALDAAIALRAYQLWEEEGHPEGRDREHWRQAEDSILLGMSISSADLANKPDVEERTSDPT